MELPLHPAAELLFSRQSAVRWVGVRALGKEGEHLNLLELVAERDEDPIVGMSAAFWLALNGSSVWLSHLGSLACELEDEGLAELAGDLHQLASSLDDDLVAEA